MIVIVDYASGNPASILNMLRKIGVEAVISSEKSVVDKASKIILPGVGAFDHGINKLKASGLLESLNKKVIDERVPFLGICLGMQLLTARSEEGKEKGLGWIDAECLQFHFPEKKLKVPHMGWNYLQAKKPSKLLTGMNPDSRFYFVHSYYVQCNQPGDILSTAEYGFPFVSAIEKENIAGVQFHPEKSHKYGIQLLKNFVDLF
jgi:glutamine amidotransferase